MAKATGERCVAHVNGPGAGYHGPHQCARRNTVRYNGRPYCTQHLKIVTMQRAPKTRQDPEWLTIMKDVHVSWLVDGGNANGRPAGHQTIAAMNRLHRYLVDRGYIW